MFSGGWASPNPAIERITLYLAQPGTPAAIPNFINPGAGCNWWGVGGQVFNEAGRPEPGLVLRVSGAVDGVAINQTMISGSSLSFGAGGFDLQLANHLPNTAALNLQVFDTAGRAQSGVIPLAVYRTCSQNLLVVNLRQRSYNRFGFLPWVRR
jgi:hypothetical protein